jgi:DNA-binding SARP family transcriptional activator
MSQIRIALLGKFCLEINGSRINKIESKKAEELFIYLLVHQDRPHHRDHIADILWGEIAPEQSKSYLRKTLWQLLSFLKLYQCGDLVLTDENWIQLNADSELILDIHEIQKAFNISKGKMGRELEEGQFTKLQHAVEMYRGDLLEGWYQDWCIFARERLQYQFLVIVDKLMDYYEDKRLYDASIRYGETIIRYDRAREHTHRHLMRLYYLSGDRTSALRQYKNCVEALREELDVKPDHQTQLLYASIQADNLGEIMSSKDPGIDKGMTAIGEPLLVILENMHNFQESLNILQAQLSNDIESIRKALKSKPT